MFRHLFGKKPRCPDPKQLLETIIAFIQAPTWDESRRILEAHPELLRDEADQLLAQLIEAAQAQNDANAEKIFAEHRGLLQRARRDGIDAAFAAKQTVDRGQPSAVGDTPAELQRLLQEIARLIHLSDMPRKVELCQRALRLLQREDNLPLWAALQDTLASALAQNPLGNRAENLERAIEHYELALQVRTREAFPEDWAMTQNNLANAYLGRIRGGRAENLEEAIRRYELAFQVRTREVFATSGC
jgi:tetratricopeptide (TPR) repeat protein